MIERVTTGIPGLDKLVSGGFVKGSTTLITGGTGTLSAVSSFWKVYEKGSRAFTFQWRKTPRT